MHVQREGLVDWVVRSVRSIPQRIADAVLGFLHEVGAVLAGMLTGMLRLVPGSSLLMRDSSRRMPASGATTTSRANTSARGGGRALGEADRRALDRRRRLLMRRLRLAAVVVVLALVVVGSWVLPRADVFRVRHVEVLGASAVGDLEVRQRVDGLLEGRTIFTADTDAIARRVEELPFVRHVVVERHLPGGLGIRVTEYRPLAVACGDRSCWLVAPDGRVLTKVDGSDWQGRVPVVRLATRHVRPGMRLPDEPGIALLRAVPAASILSFASIDVKPYSVVATTTEGDTEVRFGRPEHWATKLAVAQRIIQKARTSGRKLAYVDVSVPDHFAVCEVGSFCQGVATPTEVAAAQAVKAEAAKRAAKLRAGGATEEEVAQDAAAHATAPVDGAAAAGTATDGAGADAGTTTAARSAGAVGGTGGTGADATSQANGPTAGSPTAAPKDAFETASTTR